jgi:hypothetical protein
MMVGPEGSSMHMLLFRIIKMSKRGVGRKRNFFLKYAIIFECFMKNLWTVVR